MANSSAEGSGSSSSIPPPSPVSKFEEKLQYNVDRFAKILLNEQEEIEKQQSSSHSVAPPLVDWLEKNYGMEETEHLKSCQFSTTTTKVQKHVLKQFLEWFRENFPYYRDQCGHCNATGCTFQGNEPPTIAEKEFSVWVDTTEISVCSKCQQTNRFPRYLSAMEIVRRRKGRCSEYSLLLYRMLRSLGHTKVRWIVDYANHVWTEIWLDNDNDGQQGGRWIHLDPCEAAVDTPYMYQGWGKQQTYIVAFESSSQSTANKNGLRMSVVDATKDYTKEPMERILERRVKDGTPQEEIDFSLQRANKDLRTLSLLEIVEKHKAMHTQ